MEQVRIGRASLDGRNETSTVAIPQEWDTSKLGGSIIEMCSFNACNEAYSVPLR
jgi:hypothetical protein